MNKKDPQGLTSILDYLHNIIICVVLTVFNITGMVNIPTPLHAAFCAVFNMNSSSQFNVGFVLKCSQFSLRLHNNSF